MTARIQSPNGAAWSVVEADDTTVTLQLDVLPDGTPTTLVNEQTYSQAELETADGWRELEGPDR